MNPLNILAKFEVRSFTHSWDNEEYFKNFGSHWIRQRPLFSQIFKGFVRMDAVNIPAKFELRSFTRSTDNRGYWKNLGRPWILPRSLFSQIFKRILLGWTLWIYLPNLKFVALRIPEIIGVLKKSGKSLDTPTLPFLPNSQMAFVHRYAVNISAKFELCSVTRSWDNRGY